MRAHAGAYVRVIPADVSVLIKPKWDSGRVSFTLLIRKETRIQSITGAAMPLRFKDCAYVRQCCVEPDEERLLGLVSYLHTFQRHGSELLVSRLHASVSDRAGTFGFPVAIGLDQATVRNQYWGCYPPA